MQRQHDDAHDEFRAAAAAAAATSAESMAALWAPRKDNAPHDAAAATAAAGLKHGSKERNPYNAQAALRRGLEAQQEEQQVIGTGRLSLAHADGCMCGPVDGCVYECVAECVRTRVRLGVRMYARAYG